MGIQMPGVSPWVMPSTLSFNCIGKTTGSFDGMPERYRLYCTTVLSAYLTQRYIGLEESQSYLRHSLNMASRPLTYSGFLHRQGI